MCPHVRAVEMVDQCEADCQVCMHCAQAGQMAEALFMQLVARVAFGSPCRHLCASSCELPAR